MLLLTSYFSFDILHPNFPFLAISCFQGQNLEVVSGIKLFIKFSNLIFQNGLIDLKLIVKNIFLNFIQYTKTLSIKLILSQH